MKKNISLLLLLSFSLAFLGCTNSEPDDNTQNQTNDNQVLNEAEQPDTTSLDIESSIDLIEPEIIKVVKSNEIDAPVTIDKVQYMTISDYNESQFSNTLKDVDFDYFIKASFSTTFKKDPSKNLVLGGVDKPIFLYDAVGEEEMIISGVAFYTYKISDKTIALIPESPTKDVFDKINSWKDCTMK